MNWNGRYMPDHQPVTAASLTANLLARRGDARPAMRRQGVATLHVPLSAHEDLGWNDLGTEEPNPPTTSLVAMTPPEPVSQSHQTTVAAPPAEGSTSPVVSQIEAIAQRIAQFPREARPKSKSGDRAPRDASAGAVALGTERKAAFTLRLETDRHLRLRLLSAVTHRSAQQLLVEALDVLLADHEKVEQLAKQVETRGETPPTEAGEGKQA